MITIIVIIMVHSPLAPSFYLSSPTPHKKKKVKKNNNNNNRTSKRGKKISIVQPTRGYEAKIYSRETVIIQIRGGKLPDGFSSRKYRCKSIYKYINKYIYIYKFF